MVTLDTTVTPCRPRRPGRRVATLFALSAAVLTALTLADSAWASGSGPSPGPLAGALEAATQQAPTAVAGANQDNVQNVIVIIRINSPGDDYVSQTNTAVANAGASNTASTDQDQRT